MITVLCVCGLVLVIGLVFFANANRVSMQPESFAGQDEEHHLLRGLLVYDALRLPDRELFDDQGVTWQPRWPPLVYFTSSALMPLFGRSHSVMALTGTVYFALLLIAVFGIGWKFYSPKMGLLAVIITASFPMLFRYSGYYNLDIPLTACCAAAFYFMISSEGFSKVWPTVGFGVAFGLGLLAKITFPFILLPILVADIWGRKTGKKPFKWNSLFVSMLIAATISAFWYLPRIELIVEDLFSHVFDYNREFGLLQSESGEFFLIQAVRELGIASTLFVLAAFVLIPLRKRFVQLPIYAWLVFPVAMFALAPSDIARFAMPSLPAAALLVAMGAMRLPKLRSYVVIVLIAVVICLNAVQCFRIATQPEQWLFMKTRANEKMPWEVAVQVAGLLENDYAQRICYLQDSDSNKLSGEYFWFRMALEKPQVRFALYDLFNNRYADYERFNRCTEQQGVVLYWTDRKGTKWPDAKSIDRISKLGGIVSLRGNESFQDLDFPIGYVLKDFTLPASLNLDLALKTDIASGSFGVSYNRFFVYAPFGALKDRNKLHLMY